MPETNTSIQTLRQEITEAAALMTRLGRGNNAWDFDHYQEFKQAELTGFYMQTLSVGDLAEFMVEADSAEAFPILLSQFMSENDADRLHIFGEIFKSGAINYAKDRIQKIIDDVRSMEIAA